MQRRTATVNETGDADTRRVGAKRSRGRTRPARSLTASFGLPHLFMVLAGLVTFVLVSSVLRDRSATSDVWMVANDVPAGVALSTDDVEPVSVSTDDPLLPALLLTSAGLPSGTVRHGVVAGEPLLASDLVPAEGADVGRTFTIPVESLILDGLGLRRGDRLDVIGADADGVMRYVVADVEVVRLPGAASSTAFAAASSRTSWVTVRIDDVEALRLSAALERGEVELVRSTGAVAIQISSDLPPGTQASDAEIVDGAAGTDS